ncbi:MAG: hypothetical protein H6739_10075 [Alphaproteobacteria bacterium]|nr:hypothetical protein [Alphaproteobacteria bacterium]
MRTPTKTLAAALLALGLACGGDPEPPPPPPATDATPLADVLAGMQDGPPASTPPTDREPPPAPAGLEDPPDPVRPPPAEVRAPGSAECERARDRRETLERQVERQRSTVVLNAEQAASDAQAAMTACVGDLDCAMDGKRVQQLQERIQSSEGAYERAIEQVGALEAGFFEIDKEIRRSCGR